MRLFPLLCACCALLVLACTKSTQSIQLPEYAPEAITRLAPAYKGKYITYRLDSIVPILQGRVLATRRYLAKDVWDTLIVDNQGKPAWRIFRFLNDSLGSGPWSASTTYTLSVYNNRLEQLENNLRTIRLQLPLRDGAAWNGNQYLPFAAYGAYNNLLFTEPLKWTYKWQGPLRETWSGRQYDSVWTVEQLNQVFDTLSVANPQYRLYGIGYIADKYAVGVGLVARQLLLLENNPNQQDATTFNPYKTGFGIRMWMVDHN
ncbi:hypothetical protein SAMN05444008_12244 [Cnuella takakiae]|uniref:Uncharacterized protein n=1 Tax=Cnuella takakiae TaxID=1302690 RepID=A0A1M5I848_9BACT|nr:hypothetical protein [Cnuella takakiae]OLY93212.1 hypothetical protein BUE76_15940 [Cnuella takakiae]SHG24411.1 hypothetical protein SAMN05444008_12244 [Cnuella takakiae]